MFRWRLARIPYLFTCCNTARKYHAHTNYILCKKQCKLPTRLTRGFSWMIIPYPSRALRNFTSRASQAPVVFVNPWDPRTLEISSPKEQTIRAFTGEPQPGQVTLLFDQLQTAPQQISEKDGIVVEFVTYNQRRLGIVSGTERSSSGLFHWVVQTDEGELLSIQPHQISYQFPGQPGIRYLDLIPRIEIETTRRLLSVCGKGDIRSLVHAVWQRHKQSADKLTPVKLAKELFGERLFSNDATLYNSEALYYYAAYRLLTDYPEYFARTETVATHEYVARTPAEVAQRSMQKLSIYDSHEFGRFMQRLQGKLAGTCEWHMQEDERFLRQLQSYALSTLSAADEAEVERRVLGPLGLPLSPTAAFRLLVRLGVWKAGVNPHVLRFSKELKLPGSVVAAAAQLVATPPPDPDQDRRWDLRDLPVYVIDDPDAHEIDDGISIEQRGDGTLWLYTHVADPTRWIAPLSPLDNTARQRSSTVFLPDGAYPMLPPQLAHHAGLVITPDRSDVLSLTFAAAIDPIAGTVLRYEVAPARLANIVQISYDNVDALLRGSGSSLHRTNLWKLQQTAIIRRKYRQANGAAIIHIPDADIQIRGSHVVVKLREKTHKSPVEWDGRTLAARHIVEELMVLGGEVAARYATNHGVLIPFAFQPDDPSTVPRPSADYIEEVIRSYHAVMKMGRTRYAPAPTRHATVGLNAYSKVTSPLRRYVDMLAHHQIKAAIRGHAPPFSAAMLLKSILEFEDGERKIKQLQRDSKQLYFARFLAAQPASTVHNAVVIDTPDSAGNVATLLLLDIPFILHNAIMPRSVAVRERLRLTVAEVEESCGMVTFNEARLS